MLRLRFTPKSEETIGSWVRRVAVANGLDFGRFVAALQEPHNGFQPVRRARASQWRLSSITPDSVEDPRFLARMAAATGLSWEFLGPLRLTWVEREYLLQYLLPSGKVRLSNQKEHHRRVTWHPDSYCPECLAGDFYLRRLWRPAFPCYCPVHQRALADACPRCQSGLNYYAADRPPRRPTGEHRLACGSCGLNLTLMSGPAAHPAHRGALRFLGELFEGTSKIVSSKQKWMILDAFHGWLEAFFRTCARLPLAQAPQQTDRTFQRRKGYVYQPARVRFALMTTALKTMGRLGQREPSFTPEDAACAQWLRPAKWLEVMTTAGNLVAWFPELNDQETVGAPDRSILPSS